MYYGNSVQVGDQCVISICLTNFSYVIMVECVIPYESEDASFVFGLVCDQKKITLAHILANGQFCLLQYE